MTFRLAIRALVARPVRSAVLAGGFGFGISVMAVLLGVGEVILEQARSPDLHGHGDVVILSSTGSIDQGRFFMSSLRAQAELGGQVETISPNALGRLYVAGKDGVRAVEGRGGIPSLERAIGDAVTAKFDSWRDSPRDAAWTDPDFDDLLRSIDAFHPAPSVPGYDDSWAEWLYFNGRSDAVTFYLSFLFGRESNDRTRPAVVRLQLDAGSGIACYADVAELDAADVLARAPEVVIGESGVTIEEGAYRVRLALHATDCAGGMTGVSFERGAHDLEGELVLGASIARAMPPFVLRGARGWLSGYVVPVLEGPLGGTLEIAGGTAAGGRRLSLDGGTGYHDHNWGFWRGVTWQWGQVAADELSIVWGRVHPPDDVADPESSPAFLGLIGPGGPVGFSSSATIEERNVAGSDRPESVRVTASGAGFELELDFTVESLERSAVGSGASAADAAGVEFLQMHGPYRIRGRVGEREVDLESRGAAETFR